MPYVCRDCKNYDDFKADGYISGTCSYTERVEFSVDEEGCIIETLDTWDTDFDDYNSTDEETDGEVICACCGGNTEEVDLQEYTKLKEKWSNEREDEIIEEPKLPKPFEVTYV